MASLNPRRRLGLRPIDNGTAGTVPRIEEFRAAGSAISKNAMVTLTTAGLVTMTATTPTSANTVILGVAANQVLSGVAGAATRVVQVYTDPEQRYVIASDDNSLTQLTDYLGRNFALVSNNALNVTTGESKCELDGNTGTSAAGAGKLVKCVGAYGGVDNSLQPATGNTASFGQFIVRFTRGFHVYAKDVGV